MKNFFGIALGAVVLGAAAAAPVHGETPSDLVVLPPKHRGKGRNNRRGKGAVSRPKKHPNRLTVSKRVRRKHRRAA